MELKLHLVLPAYQSNCGECFWISGDSNLRYHEKRMIIWCIDYHKSKGKELRRLKLCRNSLFV